MPCASDCCEQTRGSFKGAIKRFSTQLSSARARETAVISASGAFSSTEPIRREVGRYFSIEREGNQLFEYRATKARVRSRRGDAQQLLSPAKTQPTVVAAVFERPRDFHISRQLGQSTVLHRIGGQFVQSKTDVLRCLGCSGTLGAFEQTLVVVDERFQLPQHKIRKTYPRPVSSTIRSWETAMPCKRCMSRVSNSSTVPPLRAVCAAIA